MRLLIYVSCCGCCQDEHLDVIYINENLNRDEWHTFEVGKTRFNDEAMRQASKFPLLHCKTCLTKD